jgi:phosphoenolpyruvate carboxylase
VTADTDALRSNIRLLGDTLGLVIVEQEGEELLELEERARKLGRAGRRGSAEAIEQLVAADPGIAILVIAASTSEKGPGPLVSHFAAHRSLHILVTIVPGAMTDEEIVAVA